MSDQGRTDRAAWEGEMFRLLAENVLDYAIFVVSPDRHVLTWTKGAERLLGYTEAEVVGQRCDRFFTPEDVRAGVPQRELDEALATGRGDDDRWHVRKDGTRFWASGAVTPLRDEGGTLRGLAKVMRDRTVLKRGQEALDDALGYAEAIVATVREPLVVLDGDLRVRTANRSFYAAFRVRPEDTEGRLLYDLGNGQWDIPALRTLLAEVLLRDAAFNDFQVEHDFPDIGPKVMLLNARKLWREGNHTELILLAIEDVTALRDAERATREAEARFAEMVRNVRDHSIFLTDTAGVITSWNVAAERIIGYPESEAVGKPFSLIFTPEDVEAGVPGEELRQAREEGRAEDERWHRRRDGTLFWALGIVTPLHDTDGRLSGYSKILRDMTDWKRADEATRDRQRQLELVTDHAPVLLAHCDTEFRYKFVNRPYAERFGLHPRDLIGRTIPEVLGGEAFARIEPHVREALAGRRVEYEAEIPYHGLGPQTMRVAYEPEFDGEGRVVGYVAAIQNVSDRKRADELLAASRRRLQALFDNTQDAILLADDDARYVDANPAACTLLGYDRDELLRRGVFDLTPAANGEAGRAAWAAFLRDGRQAGEYEVRRGDESAAVVEFKAVAHVQPGLHLSVLRDVTERKRAEAVLLQSEALLRRILDSNAIGLILADFRGNVVQANDAFLGMVGYDRADLDAGRVNFAAMTPPEYRHLDERAMDEMRREGRHAPFEKEYVRKDGSRVPVLVGTAYLGGDGGDDRGVGFVIDLTEQRAAQAAVRESEGRLRAIIDNSPSVIFVKDADGRYLLANRACEGYSGEPPERMIGKTDRDYLPAEYADRFRADDLRVLRTGEVVRYEEEALLHGRMVTALTVKFPLRDAAGRPYAVCGIATDVTELKRTGEALRESEARFRAIFDQTVAGVAQTDLTGRFVLVNQRYCEVAGRTADELYGLRMQDITHPDDLPGNAELFGEMVRGGRPFEIEKRYVRPDGSPVWVHNSVSLVRDEGGRPRYTVAVTLDVTERRRVELERDRLISVIEYSPDFIGIADLDQRAFFVNRAGQRLVGLDGPEAVRNTGVLDYFPQDERERVQREVMPVLLEKGHWDGEVNFRHFRTGERIPMRWNVFTLPDPATGRPAFLACVSRDVTEQRRAMEALRDADRRKDEFLATLAHELRNPLAPLRNGLQVMKMAAGDADAVERSRAMMERQLGQMVRLIDDLLDVSRITRGKLVLRRERVDLAAVVQSAVEGSRPLVEAAGHELTVELPPDPVYLDADPVRLAQVFANLLTNAAKYTERGGRVRLTAERTGGKLVVSVRDTGIGIAPEHLPRLFEMFSQVDAALDRSQGGLGIGLSLVKGLVEMHGGTVEARSEGPGRGSEFVVRLPAADGPDAGGPPHPVGGGGDHRPRRRVLVADDNRDAADSLAMVLRLAGHEVHAVHDGRAAVEAAGWFRPDVALLDIGMPTLNGYEAARLIRGRPHGRSVVLVAVTGWGQDEDRRRAAEAGFDHHLTKPADPAALGTILAGARPASG